MATAIGVHGETYEVPDVVENPETTETPVVVTTDVTPTVVPSTEVETPAAIIETPVVEEPVITPSVVEEPTPTEVIKEVEKIVEKYPEMDDYTKEVFDALMAGEEDKLLSYLSEKHRDYNKMSDYDVVKAELRLANPNWTNEDLDLKIEVKYGEIAKIDTTDLDPDSVQYEQALDHNKAVEKNIKILKLDAVEARQSLETAKKEIKLPKIDKPQVEATPAITPEAIEAAKQEWISKVEKELPEVKEFTFKVGDKDSGYEDVSFKVADNDRSELSGFLKDLDLQKMVARLGWVDAEGKQNIQKMAGDVLKLEKMPQIISSAYTQGKTTGTKGTIVEIKNLDLNGNSQSSVAETPPDIGLQAWGHING